MKKMSYSTATRLLVFTNGHVDVPCHRVVSGSSSSQRRSSFLEETGNGLLDLVLLALLEIAACTIENLYEQNRLIQ